MKLTFFLGVKAVSVSSRSGLRTIQYWRYSDSSITTKLDRSRLAVNDWAWGFMGAIWSLRCHRCSCCLFVFHCGTKDECATAMTTALLIYSSMRIFKTYIRLIMAPSSIWLCCILVKVIEVEAGEVVGLRYVDISLKLLHP